MTIMVISMTAETAAIMHEIVINALMSRSLILRLLSFLTPFFLLLYWYSRICLFGCASRQSVHMPKTG